MATRSMTAEFSVARSWESNRQNAIRWLLSHVLRHKLYIVGIFIGALGNSIGAGLVALHLGWGFDAVSEAGDITALGWIAISLIATQVVRGGDDVRTQLLQRGP